MSSEDEGAEASGGACGVEKGIRSVNETVVEDGNGKNVGILGMEVYTPSTYISQSSLEELYGVSEGRYTVGLGQEGLAVCGDGEDVNSLALTVVKSLLEKYGVGGEEVGRLEVGTETLVDKSKSTKTVLMELFAPNSDIEGATVINACYGGTAALLNAFAWAESDGWDGRYAIVVAADIATYARGPARPTCGAGAVAVLVGRDAPLSFSDPRQRATHAANVWDFFKPDHAVEYPTVDGALSQLCYYKALEDCYRRFADKIDDIAKVAAPAPGAASPERPSAASHHAPRFHANSPDYFVFHAPYNKLVQKSYARLFFLDARRTHRRENDSGHERDASDKGTAVELEALADYLDVPIEDTYTDRALDGILKNMSAASFKQRLADANYASKHIGNTYAASVFVGLASLIDRAGGRGDLSPGKKVAVFSYGSGCMATMYLLHIRTPKQTRFTVQKMSHHLSLTSRLKTRERVSANELDLALETRSRMHKSGAPYDPIYPSIGRLFPGTYYLKAIDAKWRRTYCRVPLDATMDAHGSPLAPPVVLRWQLSTPVTGKLKMLNEFGSGDSVGEESCVSNAPGRIACVITGVSAGLPGNEGQVFHEDNLSRLVKGEQCIEPLKESVKAALLEKNVVQLTKSPDGTVTKTPVQTEAQHIRLAAQLGNVNLTALYGIPGGLAQSMDIAAQVAVAAGFEALKSARLVSGRSNDPSEWKLPEEYRDSTGVVYASSFPAMDAAVGEVMRFLEHKTVGAAQTRVLIEALRARMVKGSGEEKLGQEDEAAFAQLLKRASDIKKGADCTDGEEYVFDRKFLFRVLVLGNAQLAQLAGCRGPNTQTNAACAGTTQAIGMAQDMLISGRADRVVVIAGDNASGDTLLPWLGAGFRALGAATTAGTVEEAALPFDKRRSGMLLGAGGIGMVLETETSAHKRDNNLTNGSTSTSTSTNTAASSLTRARLLATQYSNSAFHGAALDRNHIASELKRFLVDVELIHGITKGEIATHGVYFSHETSTHASDASSCAGNECAALREVFGDQLLKKLLILNTKGFTGHPMGVSFEDVTAVEVLMSQTVPPVSNYAVKDDYLGDLNISKGGAYTCRYALRFAAGFGSQVAFALYASA